jgi:hypothetical protein
LFNRVKYITKTITNDIPKTIKLRTPNSGTKAALKYDSFIPETLAPGNRPPPIT